MKLKTPNKPRHLQPSAAATLTSSRACAGLYARKGIRYERVILDSVIVIFSLDQ